MGEDGNRLAHEPQRRAEWGLTKCVEDTALNGGVVKCNVVSCRRLPSSHQTPEASRDHVPLWVIWHHPLADFADGGGMPLVANARFDS